MKWINANSFRTSHYPYAEEIMDMADQQGFLVIDEAPAVGLSFHHDTTKLMEQHKKSMADLVQRDKNHPSVIIWSVANEPDSGHKNADTYFKQIYNFAKKCDATRPIAMVTYIGRWNGGTQDCRATKHFDLVTINRYLGWYIGANYFAEDMQAFSRELDDLYRKFKKPIIITEFGAEAVAGLHALPDQMHSEEYQATMVAENIKVIESKPFTAGEHIWNFADFMTAQTHTRTMGNRKGVFTRERQPKYAAHVVRQLWAKQKNYKKV